DLIRPSIAVDVGDEVDEAVAIRFGRVELFNGLNLMRLPVRRLVPEIACDHVRPAVVIDVSDGDAFRAEFAVERDLFETDLSGSVWRGDGGMKLLRGRRSHHGEAERQNTVTAASRKRIVHSSFSWKRFSMSLSGTFTAFIFAAQAFMIKMLILESRCGAG